MHCCIGLNTVDHEDTPSFIEANSSSSFDQGKHRFHNPSIDFSHYNIYFMFMIVHLCIGVLCNLVALGTPLQEYLVYPYERIVNDSMLCLVCSISVEDEWSKITRDMTLSSDGGPMLYKYFAFEFCGTIWDRVGQLGESREYRMRRIGRGLLSCLELWRW
jgi:hypothetical protein